MDNERWNRMMDMLEKLLERQSSPPAINVNVVLPDGKRKKTTEESVINDPSNDGSSVTPSRLPHPYIT